MGIISGSILFANILRQKVRWVRSTLMPTAVIAGFLLLFLRGSGLLDIDLPTLEMVTYHGIALGFIAMSLKIEPKSADSYRRNLDMPKTGALIVSSYLVQGILGLLISLGLAYTIMPDMFKAAGILLPMGYGQGPGQANNIGSMYESFGFVGGRSFGLSIAAAGYLSACVVGIAYIRYLSAKGKIRPVEHEELSGSVTVEIFQENNEIPISESIDRFSVQIALVFLVYLLTYLVTRGITGLVDTYAPGLSATISNLLWGFNFILGSVIALLVKSVLGIWRRRGIMSRQYQNGYLLSRISGMAFDIMIVAGIASINMEDLTGLWLPFLLMSISAALVTLVFLIWMSRKIYPQYEHEGMLGMYGMMTGTISSGILLLREVDPEFKTPSAGNLVGGSSFAIIFGAPMLILIGLAPKSATMTFIVLGLLVIYLILLLAFMLFAGKPKASEEV